MALNIEKAKTLINVGIINEVVEFEGDSWRIDGDILHITKDNIVIGSIRAWNWVAKSSNAKRIS